MSVQWNVVQTLLPSALIECVQQDENQMVATATLIVNLIKDTIIKIQKLQIRALDANPGDRGCQMRALILRQLLIKNPDLKELQNEIEQLDKILQDRRTRKHNLKERDLPTAEFFNKHIAALHVSQDTMFLIECRLLTMTKVPNFREKTGVIVTKLDHGKLPLGIENAHRKSILDDVSIECARESLKRVQEVAKCRLKPSCMQSMLMVVRHSHPEAPYKPKPFGCLFFQVKLLLTVLEEEKAVVAIKTVVLKGKPEISFFQLGEGCQVISQEKLDPETLIIVFEGVVGSLQELKEQISEKGFAKVILACAASVEQFEHGAKLEDAVTNPEGLEEIKAHQQLQPLIALDHVFCNSVKEELKICC